MGVEVLHPPRSPDRLAQCADQRRVRALLSADCRHPDPADHKHRSVDPLAASATRHGVAESSFIPLAEETGLINPIGEWVLRKACFDAMRIGRPHIKVSVNLSAVQFRKIGPIDNFNQVLRDCGLPPERLELEITESVLLQGNAENVGTLHRLRGMGISIVLDDFGTGYSSLSYLRMFPFDKIKIDRSFVHELAKNADCAAIVSAVAGLGPQSAHRHCRRRRRNRRPACCWCRPRAARTRKAILFGRPCPTAELDFAPLRAQPQTIKVA